MLRGPRIVCFGSADPVRLDAARRKRRLIPADEVLCLHPDQVWLRRAAIDVDADPLPEVDHTTNVRWRKLEIYYGRAGFLRCGCWSRAARPPASTRATRFR